MWVRLSMTGVLLIIEDRNVLSILGRENSILPPFCRFVYLCARHLLMEVILIPHKTSRALGRTSSELHRGGWSTGENRIDWNVERDWTIWIGSGILVGFPFFFIPSFHSDYPFNQFFTLPPLLEINNSWLLRHRTALEHSRKDKGFWWVLILGM